MAAVIGLIGVALGALVTQIGSFLTDRRQSRTEANRWNRDQKAAAYGGALRYLLRAANLRSDVVVREGKLVALYTVEGTRQMFDDLVEAQFWVHTLETRCGAPQTARIMGAATHLDEYIDQLVRGNMMKSRLDEFLEVITTITECAREDGGGSTAEAS